jgi:hypothetical protein
MEPAKGRPAETWRERVERASLECDYKKLLELARQLTTHLTERLESQRLKLMPQRRDSYGR